MHKSLHYLFISQIIICTALVTITINPVLGVIQTTIGVIVGLYAIYKINH